MDVSRGNSELQRAPDAAELRFSIVIPTLGRSEALSRCLESVRRLDPAPHEVIVVDGAPDGAPTLAEDVVYLPAERGLTRQRNAALGVVTGDVVLFLDDDVQVPRDALTHLAAAYADGSVVGATGRVIEPTGGRRVDKESRFRLLLFGGGEEGGFTSFGYPRRAIDLEVPQDISFMQGCFMSARVSAARALQFDEALTGYALAEDEDFSYRLSRVGRIRYLPHIVVDHANLGFLTKDERAFGRQVVVNRAYLFKKNFPQTRAARARFGLFLGLLIAHRLINREWQGARGLLEGMRALRRGAETAPKVTFVSSHARHGGSERCLTTLLDSLARDEVNKVLVLEEGPLVDELNASGAEVQVLPVGGSPLALLGALRPLRRTLREERSAVVHANGVKAALLASLASVGGPPPVVWLKHDFSWDGPLASLVALLCKRIVGVSQAVVDPLPGWAKRKVSVVPPALRVPSVDPELARSQLRERLGLAPGTRVVAHVGRMHPVKGHAALVTALGMPPLLDEHVHLVMAGGTDPSHTSYETEVRDAIQRNDLGDRVHLVGHVPDIPMLLAGSDLLAITSGRDERGMGLESFSLVALEALTVGTPVVAFAAGGIPEVVGDCARLVPLSDIAGLGAAISDALKDEDWLRQASACGRQRVDQHFRIETMVAAMRDVYVAASGAFLAR